MIKTVTIVGLGMIGASLADQLKKAGITVIGWARRKETLSDALDQSIIDSGFAELNEAVKHTDLVILCTPIDTISNFVSLIEKSTNKPLKIIDVSSIKKPIMDDIAELNLSKVSFIGGHPMAGSEKTGLQNRKTSLFTKKPFVFTYPDALSKTANEPFLKAFCDILEAIYIDLSATEHDELVSIISHTPYLISAVLNRFSLGHDRALLLASTGLDSMTRIGKSDPEWGATISMLNREPILEQLNEIIDDLNNLKLLLANGDIAGLCRFLNVGNRPCKNLNNIIKYVSNS